MMTVTVPTPESGGLQYTISVNGYNLGNRRDAVLASELGERQFYLLPARRVFVKMSKTL